MSTRALSYLGSKVKRMFGPSDSSTLLKSKQGGRDFIKKPLLQRGQSSGRTGAYKQVSAEPRRQDKKLLLRKLLSKKV